MGRNTSHHAVVAERRARAWDLRVAGKTLRDIAAALHVGLGTVARDVEAIQATYERQAVDTLAAMRRLEGERLDALQHAVWTKAEGGDVPAVRACVTVMQRRAALFGLDAPAAHVAAIATATPDRLPLELVRRLVEERR